MNSMSATVAPAACASAMPSPVEPTGFVVDRYMWPAPPVARTVVGENRSELVPSAAPMRKPIAEPSSACNICLAWDASRTVISEWDSARVANDR